MKSIMQQKDGRCYLCELLNQDFSVKPVEEHHAIFGSSGRALSTKYGLIVYLCHEHHRTSKNAVHQNHEMAALIQDKAQRAFEKHFSDLDFMSIFGRNYKLDDEETEREEEAYGFISIIVGGENNYENDSSRDC